MLRGLQLDPLSQEPHDNSATLQSRVTKAVAPAQRGNYRKLPQLQLPSQHLALAPTAHAAGGGRLTRSAAADAAAAEVMLGLAGASACSAAPSHDPSPTVGTPSSPMGPPSTAVSPAVDQGPVAAASLPAASRLQSAAFPSLPAMQPGSIVLPGQHQAATASPGCLLPVADLVSAHPAGAAIADSQMVLAHSSAPRGSPPSKASYPPPQGVRHQLDPGPSSAALLPTMRLSATAFSTLEDLLKDPAAALALSAREAAGPLADVEVPKAPRPRRLCSAQSTPGWRCALTLPSTSDDRFQRMREVGPLPAPAALDSAAHEYSAVPARPMMASNPARFTTGHNALVSRHLSWQPSKPGGPTGDLALPSGSGRAARADASQRPGGTDTMADPSSPHDTAFTTHDSTAAPEQPASATSGSPAELHQLPPLVPRRLSHASNAGNSDTVNATISRWAATSGLSLL